MDTTTLLIVLRHAHAEKAAAGQEDYDRSLDDRGRTEAREAGRALLEQECRPARIVSSGSARTRETLSHLGADFDGIETTFADEFYHRSAEAYLAAAKASADAGPLMLVGHNPSVAEFIASVCGNGEPSALRRLAQGVPPGSFAVIAFDKPLSGIGRGDGFLRHLFLPTRR